PPLTLPSFPPRRSSDLQDWLPHTGRRNRLPHQIWSAACFVTLSSLLAAVSCGAEVPDVIYYNGNIVTISASQPRAQAVAIKANRDRKSTRLNSSHLGIS